MGASLARAVRAAGSGRADRGGRAARRGPRAGVADGVVDEALAAPGAALAACQLAVLCTPVAAIEALMAPVSRLLADGAILTDVGGAKERVVAAARSRRSGRASASSGRTRCSAATGGYDAATADRWKGGTVAVCTDGDAGGGRRVAALHAALGATVVRCAAAEHDAAVAMVSHLPYLVASALAAAAKEAGPLAVRLAGPGLKDMTRLASFAFDIQGEVARRNAHLPEAARRLERHLTRLLGAIAESPEAARGALEAARAAREELF